MKFRFSFFAFILLLLTSPLPAAKKTVPAEDSQLQIEEELQLQETENTENGIKKHEWCIFYKNEKTVFAGPFDTVEEALEAWITSKKVKSGAKYYIGRDKRLFTNTPETYYRRKFEAVQKAVEEKKAAELANEQKQEQETKKSSKKDKKKKEIQEENQELTEETKNISEEPVSDPEKTVSEAKETASVSEEVSAVPEEEVVLTKKQLKEKEKAEKAEKKAKEKEEKAKLKEEKKKKKNKNGDQEENAEIPEPAADENQVSEKTDAEVTETPEIPEVIEPEEIQIKALPQEPGMVPEELLKQIRINKGTTTMEPPAEVKKDASPADKKQEVSKTTGKETSEKTKYSPFEVPLTEETKPEKNEDSTSTSIPEIKFSETESTNKENRLNRPYLSDFISNDIFGIPENDSSNIEEDFIEEANEADSNGVTALMKAVKEGNDWKIRTLIRSKADVNAKDKEGWTPLMYAARYQSNLTVLELILSEKADPKAVNNYGLSPLIIAACFNDNPDVIKKLLSYYSPADKEVQKAFVQLVSTQQSDNFALVSKVKIFLDFGFPVNSYYEGKTPLMYTCKYCTSTKVIKLLLDKNAAVNVRSTEGKTAFDYAQGNKALPKDEIYWSLNKR